MTRRASVIPQRPRKRRRVRSQASMASKSLQLTWPPARVPVEIFDEVTTYLSRSDVKNMRLVNHEFDRMVSAKYFRNVVVPFRSDTYKARQRKALTGVDEEQTESSADTLFSDGMRIFQSFGDHIFRFALSLELDEDNLAYPPIKPNQKAITSYWGIYRWPHESYLRYTELEGLEQTADETTSMREALRCLTKVRELGLCCDAGLGYLLGPDHHSGGPPPLHPVFGLRNLRYRSLQQRRLARPSSANKKARKGPFKSPRDFKYHVLESMVKIAGYTQEQAKDAINMLLRTENVSIMNIDFDERTAGEMPTSEFNVSSNTVPNANANATANANAITGGNDAVQQNAVSLSNGSFSDQPLQPRHLTRAQKEMLLELEWAHRALIQSYVVALIDNAGTNSFSCLTTLTIAKIPSSHVFMFQRHDFWRSLPNLTNVALAVVADWRHISKVAPGCVEDHSVSPVDAVVKVQRLLQDHIARQPNITFLHFEWICGGEFAPGVTQRNQYVLPAPFCAPLQMVQPDTAKTPKVLLSLPHIEHLSLKNCYSTPHVFLQVLRGMALQSLEKLELESVSLTGAPGRNQAPVAGLLQAVGLFQPPPLLPVANQLWQANLNANPAPVIQAGFGQIAAGLPGHGPQQVAHAINVTTQTAQPAAGGPVGDRMLLKQPKLLTWPGIVERLAPAPTIKDLMARQDDIVYEPWTENLKKDDGYSYIARPRSLVKDKSCFGLEHISFKTCGYVGLEVAFINNHNILPTSALWQEPQDVMLRRRELASDMQYTTDRLAAKITNHMTPQEQFNLTTAYGMDFGWINVYDQDVILAAKRDGIMLPGHGRFSGTITKTSQ